MKRCNKAKRRGSLSTRQFLIIKQGRKLTSAISRSWFRGDHRRRHIIRIVPKYRSKAIPFKIKNYCEPGKTLRNKKHHVPKYKLERTELDWFTFYTRRSTNSRWHKNRVNWFNIQRDIRKVHIKYMDNNLQPHWWKI